MIPYVLAVLACSIAGAMGGYILARPDAALALRGLAPAPDGRGGLAAARGYGAMLLVAHAGVAGLLGYYPALGAGMALALGLLWAGAALGRIASGVLDGPADGAGVQTLLLEVLMALTLSLPMWTGRQIQGGPLLTV
ncbi:MAG: DUF4345 domain-containing protein [Pseudomonadota bacterium]